MPQFALAQETPATAGQPATSDLFFGGYVPVVCFKFAGGASRAFLYDGGIEYDRHNLGTHMSTLGHYLNYPGRLLHTRLDYAAEFTPLVILREPTLTDKYGDPLSNTMKTVPGLGISPLGFRMLWRGDKAIKPLWSFKLGGVVFTQKALSTTATYANFSAQVSVGAQVKLTPRTDLRLGYEFFHFSNLYVNGSNPGLDNQGPNFGIVYHLPSTSKW